ncbi:MAG: N-acetylmuramoyl-L-alanine amidase [Lachnospiraceae bacterium]
MRNKRIRLLSIFLIPILMLATPLFADAKQAKENVIVVIDPGHGGTNLGAQPIDGNLEKNMTMITALAMKAELEKYDGVTVYLTRTSDVTMSLEERAVAAQSVNADFLFSIHYNLSASHNFYGSEVWAQSTGENYTKGYAVGKLLLDEYKTYFNTYDRGVKVKLNKKGGEYYGILRTTSERAIPAVIVEHCHLDHQNDIGYANTIQKLQAFGLADATAVAKYFGLASPALGVDYADYPQEKIPAQAIPMIQDLTPPELINVQMNRINQEKQTLDITMNAVDSNTGILYYSYTADGGQTWSLLQPWTDGQMNAVTIEIPAAKSGHRLVAIRAYNGYDAMSESAPVVY